MSIFENRCSYLFVRLTEPYSLKMVFSFLREFAEVCDQQHLDKALVDGLIVDGPISIWDRYQIGEEFMKIVGPKIGVAVVVKRNLIDLTMENVSSIATAESKFFTKWSLRSSGWI